MNPTRGLALRCDGHGNIVEVLHNPPDLGVRVETGMSFARLAIGGSLAKALSFLVEVRQNGAAFDWEISVAAESGYKILRFVGGKLDDHLLIAGSDEADAARRLYEELVSMSNEQADRLRVTRRQNAADHNLYDEISRLNNELVTLQRKLAKQNAELERLYAEAQKAAMLDSLTGVYNRRGFVEAGEREMQRASRYNRPLAAILFDIDHFKRINDTHGHAIGDLVLKETAGRCHAALRKVDVLGRYGGEEFVLLLPEMDRQNAMTVAERLRAALSQPIQTGDLALTTTASFGVAARKSDTPDLDGLLHRADQSLYAAKEAGRNCVRAEPA